MTSFISIVKLPKNKRSYRRPLEIAISNIYNELDLKRSVTIKIRQIKEETEDWDKTYYGLYEEVDRKNHEIEINSLLFDMKTSISLFKTICHEMYHAYQIESKKTLSEKNAERCANRLFKKFYKDFSKEVRANEAS